MMAVPDGILEWTEIVESEGKRRIKNDAPDDIKQKAKEHDKVYYQMTGRHRFIIDY